jgi:cytochrome c-type biogenesis protein
VVIRDCGRVIIIPALVFLEGFSQLSGTVSDPTLLLTFSTGILTPFIGVGLIGGYALSKQISSYRVYLKKISGIVLTLFGLCIIL